MAIGRPISLTPNIATKNISSLATADQTEFTVTGGYRINEIAVYTVSYTHLTLPTNREV